MRTSPWLDETIAPARGRTAATFFIDAEEYYARLRETVERAGTGSLICWAGFQSSTATPMPAQVREPVGFDRRTSYPDDVTWFDVLAAATGRGADLRVLLNLHPDPTTSYRQANLDVVSALNRLPHTAAINDFRYLNVNGTHHQKLVVVHDGRHLTAFVATMDVRSQRIEERWCEMAVQLGGAAARDVYRVFHERWVEHQATVALLPADRRELPEPDQVKVGRGSGRSIAQVATTYGNPLRDHPLGRRRAVPAQQVLNQPHRFQVSRRPPVWSGNDFFTGVEPSAPTLLDAAAAQPPTYSFAPTGRHQIYDVLRTALARPSRTIYLEDQYLVADQPMGELASMLALLQERVADPDFRSLVVLTTRIAEIDRHFISLAGVHRRAFVEGLIEAGGDKVVICQYRSHAALGTGLSPAGASPFYVHSKTWIFDDELVVTGSANCNRRGYSHDSELDVAITDPIAVRTLRQRLWYRRLNAGLVVPQVPMESLVDPQAATRFWADPARYGLPLESHRIGLETFMPRSSATPPRSWGDLATERLARLYQVGPTRLHRFLWDCVIDPEGT